VADTCEYGDEISGSINAGNFLTGCKTSSFSRRTLIHGVRNYYRNDTALTRTQGVTAILSVCKALRPVGKRTQQRVSRQQQPKINLNYI
jgi:hypothetical protein